VIFRAKRAFAGTKNDIHISLALFHIPVMVNGLMRVFRGLTDLAAYIKGKPRLVGEYHVGAGLNIGMEGCDIAPVSLNLEHIGNAAERMVENPVDIHMHFA